MTAYLTKLLAASKSGIYYNVAATAVRFAGPLQAQTTNGTVKGNQEKEEGL